MESASFSLVIPALTAAFSSAISAGRRDILAVALSDAARPHEAAFMRRAPTGFFSQLGADRFAAEGSLPLPQGRLDLVPPMARSLTPREGIQRARKAALRAHCPISNFPVGCAITTQDGRLAIGANVEHEDWTRMICAERTALASAFSRGLVTIAAIFVTCLKDQFTQPCGACRQLIVELAPAATVWLDRGDAAPERSSPSALLPGAFSGTALPRSGRAD